MKKIKLFCFPYAGGLAHSYNKLKRYLGDNIEQVPIEYAGHGRRIKEPFYEDMSKAVSDTFNFVCNNIDDEHYSFFGHSMGGLIAYETCHKLIEAKYKEPLHLFISGRLPPHIKKESDNISHLPDKEFIEEILKIGGTPKEVFENQDLINMLLMSSEKPATILIEKPAIIY